MVIMGTIALSLAAILFVLFVRTKDLPEPIPVSPIQHLEDRKQAIYDNLRDLQFEYRLGKLSDDDYRSTKQSLQKELALVLAETEATVKRLGLVTVNRKASATPAAVAVGTVCPHCQASFPRPLKFCGECGKAMTA